MLKTGAVFLPRKEKVVSQQITFKGVFRNVSRDKTMGDREEGRLFVTQEITGRHEEAWHVGERN